MKRFYIKIRILFLILAAATVLCSCSAKVYTPIISTEFEYNALCKIGDFSYDCKVIKTKNELSVIPTTTYASGMKMTFNGKTLTFSKNNMVESYDSSSVAYPNPAMLMYEVFATCEAMQNVSVQKQKDAYAYVGKISVGNFKLIQNEDNSYRSLHIENADMTIVFK